MYTRFVLISLLAPVLLAAGEPPAMPMQARYEDSAAFRWSNKTVLESRLLDDMENLSTWTFHGEGDMALTTERVQHGGHALRLRAIPPAKPPAPAGPAGSYGSNPYWSQIEATRRVPDEDWTRFNRISVWIYPEIAGIDAISFFLTLHNGGAEKLPDMSRREGYHFFILQNRAWNHVVWEIGPLARDKVTALDFSYSVPKTVAEPDDHVLFDLDQLELERVDADHYEGWKVAPGRISFSHSGYPAGATKTAIASDLDASEFQLIRMDGAVVLRKPVNRVTTRLGQYQILDFSEVREPGTYAIQAGGRATRPFAIGDDSWRGSIWKALNFLYVERCGFEIPGVHGVCHRDALLTHNGKQIVMNGGWHDAGDLSQGPVNTSNAVYGLLALAERMQARGEDPVLCRRVIEEAKWGLDWVLKTRFGDGYRATFIGIDSYTNGIIGDFDDRRVEARNNSSVNYLSAAVEARAWRVLKESDPETAQRSLRTAQEDWEFAVQGSGRRRPVAPGAYAGPDMELAAIGIIASTDLYQDTGEKRYADKAFELAEVVIGSQQQKLPDWKTPLAGFFYTNPRQEELYHASHVGNEQAPVVAMARLCQLFPDHPDWMRWYAVAALHSEYYLKAAARFTEPYGVLPASVYRESEALQIPETGDDDMTPEIFRDQIRHGLPLGGNYFLRMYPIWNERRGQFGVLLSQTKALAAAAQLRGDTEGADLAGRQVEWVLGRNPFGESAMYGEGYDFPPQYSERSGDIVGSLPVGIETRANNDEPYWPVQNCFNYKEVWVHPVARWFWLMEDVAGPALVEGVTPAATREPVEFRPLSGSESTVVTPDFRTGRFRAWLPQGRYLVSHGGVHMPLALLPGGTRRVDLRPAQVVGFHISSEAGAGGVVTLRLTPEGAGRHTFTLRAFNLDVRDPEKTMALEPGKPTNVVWQAALKSPDVPWVVVAFPDGDLSQRQEATGALPK